MYWNGPGYYIHDRNASSTNAKYIAESDDPNLTSISGYTHLGVYNGHSYFSSNDVLANWNTTSFKCKKQYFHLHASD